MEIIKNIEEVGKSITDSVKERVSGPMYGYFVIAWSITNWKIFITLFFIDQNLILELNNISKIDYISALYPLSSLWTISKLFLIPALATWFCVWIVNRLGVVFYKKNLEHKIKKDIAKRQAEYDVNAFQYAAEHANKANNDKIYNKNEEFNQWYDEQNTNRDFSASEGLFRTDPIAYKNQLNEWKKEEFRDEIIDEHKEDLIGEAQYEADRDK